MASREQNDHVGAYETYEERIRPIVLFTILLTVVTLSVLGLMKLANDAFTRAALASRQPAHPLAAEREKPPEPRLQEAPALDLERFRAREEDRLTSYGWVDRQAGVVHVPIARAMEISLREGFPVNPGPVNPRPLTPKKDR